MKAGMMSFKGLFGCLVIVCYFCEWVMHYIFEGPTSRGLIGRMGTSMVIWRFRGRKYHQVDFTVVLYMY